MKKFTLSILGCGSRGGDAYGALAFSEKEKFQIVSICDPDNFKLEKYGKLFGVEKSNLFTSEEDFLKERRSDALVIATLDKDHVRQCLKAMALGYDILLEKPISSDENELYALLEAQQKYGNKVLVCHVLRYAPAFVKVKELLESGVVGKLVNIDSTEQVAFWHYVHSYVRGNWRRSEETSPMILAKCCHDLDLLQYYAKSRAESVSSIGSLSYFKEENAPKDAALRCTDCRYKETCPYSVFNVYIKKWKDSGCPENWWPYNVVAPDVPVTEEKLMKAISTGKYGRCVFHSDNNVVDNQITTIHFENGVNAVLKMIAFSYDIGRITLFYGTDGEIELDETRGIIVVKPFGKETMTININDLVVNDSFGHGGGDYGTINAFYDMLCGKDNPETSLSKSVESHLMGIAAEKSRLNGGQTVIIKH